LFSVLRRTGAALDDSIATEICSRIALDADGSVICELPIRTLATAWDRIYRTLRRTLPESCHRAGMQLVRFEQDAGSVCAISPTVRARKAICSSEPTACNQLSAAS
jgi:hypothetical protein